MAGILSGDEAIKKDVLEGIDVHQRAADTLTQYGQPTSRQEAKARTFAPIYGAVSGTDAEMTYYNLLLNQFCPGLGRWHRQLEEEALSLGKITLPTGREYAFPHMERTAYGVKGGTRLKNFPVQGAATADLVPISVIMVWRELQRRSDLNSVLINTVHDSVVLDVYPGEEVEVAILVAKTMLDIDKEIQRRYNYELTIPLGVELSIGDDWYNQEEIMQAEQTGWYKIGDGWEELETQWKNFQNQKQAA
jgi:DNA polymerase I-like protein with 3'-5' exonuclease and polymerase domains